MANELTVVKSGEVAYAPSLLVPQSVGEGMTLAKMLSESSLVPKHLQGKVADCFLIVEQSMRWGMSPFAVAQATSLISGKLMFEGKLVAAVINAKADLAERLRFDYSGEGESRKVTVRGTFRGEKDPRSVEVSLREARTGNEMWRRQPDQQLAYHGARVWARRHAPEVMLGIYAPEEMATPANAEQGEPRATYEAPPNSRGGIMTDTPPDITPVTTLPEEYTEPVPVYEPRTGEQVSKSPGITSEQNKHIHALLNKLGHHMNEMKRGTNGKAEVVHLAKYRKKLREKFSKEHTNELSIVEASWVIEWLLKCDAKLDARLDRDLPPIAPAPVTPSSEDMGPLLELTQQLVANGHKGVDAQVAWVNKELATMGHPSVLSPSMLTAPQIDRLLAVAQGQA